MFNNKCLAWLFLSVVFVKICHARLVRYVPDWYACCRVRLFPIVFAFVQICHTRLVQCVAVWNTDCRILVVAGCMPLHTKPCLVISDHVPFCSFFTNCPRPCGIISPRVVLPQSAGGFSPNILCALFDVFSQYVKTISF